MPRVWQEGAEGTLRVVVHNGSKVTLRTIEVGIEAPYALRLERQSLSCLNMLAPGEEREVVFVARAIAPLPSASLHVTVTSANGGSAMICQPFLVEGRPAQIAARLGLFLRE